MKLLSTIILALSSLNGLAQNNANDNTMPFVYRGHIYLQTTINDNLRVNTLFDTGAANIFGIDSVALAQSTWHPQKVGKARAGGAAGSTMVRVIADGTKVQMGNVVQQYQIVPIFKLRDVVNRHVDGIWGIKDISKYPLEINFEKQYLKQYTSTKPNTEGYQQLPIKYENNRIMLQAEVQLGGKKIRGWYLMDTGSGSSVTFTSRAMTEFTLDKIEGKRYLADMTQPGIGDKAMETSVEMMSDHILIGCDTIRYTDISYVQDGVGAMGDRPYLGIIGNDVWDRFNIIIDAKKQMLYLRRHKADEPIGKRYGYGWRNRTDICRGWVVFYMNRSSEAHEAGVEIGDTITTINGRDVRDYTWDEEEALRKAPHHELDLVTPQGQKKHVILEAKEYW